MAAGVASAPYDTCVLPSSLINRNGSTIAGCRTILVLTHGPLRVDFLLGGKRRVILSGFGLQFTFATCQGANHDWRGVSVSAL